MQQKRELKLYNKVCKFFKRVKDINDTAKWRLLKRLLRILCKPPEKFRIETTYN